MTIELIGKAVSDTIIQWEVADDLYTFDSRDLHDWCRSLDESISEIVIVGHNPALTDCCNELKNDCLWKELPETTFLRPKELMT